MMSADWTAIRRRLAVRRTAHRPPRGRRQVGHSSIVAPLAATLAASVAVGIGVALAAAERGRRSAKTLRARQRRFAQLPGEPLGEALQRMTLGQLDLAIELLARDGDLDGDLDAKALDARAIHETRKALKRLRTLVRLLREELGEQLFRREHEILRDAARRLAGARDAEVMVGTLDALLQRHPRKLARRRSLIELRKRLVAERVVAVRRAGDARDTRAQVLRELRSLRERAQRWNLPERPGIALVEKDLRWIYRQGYDRKGRVARGKGGARKLHEWRKRVKDLRYAAEILGLGPLARRAEELGDLLGEEHDLVVLAAQLPPPGQVPFRGKRGRRARKILLSKIAQRRRRLRKRALREAERLYRRKPKKFTRRVRRAHARASRASRA
jgi:CHAD domain-containing protein